MMGVAASVAAGVVGTGCGLVAGMAIRRLLARIRRGVVLQPGPVEAACAVVSAAGAVFAIGTPLLGLVIWAGLLLVALGAVDIARHRLPDALTLPAVPITAALVVATDLLAPGTGSVPRALLSGGALLLVFGLLALLAPAAMGRGDVKLVASIGLALGYLSWAAMAVGIISAFVLAAAVSLIGIVTRRLRASSAIAFGPFLLAGCWLVLVAPDLTEVVTG